ncbi:hypothetical protein KC19_10G013000 [Ceratodon purpureus]|uniref:Uncharacterized protein n=1 Tax=Ceratodon purpureus TaxID=3225 RepID=A0A8T0GGS3_CERPU|nr:hypothetical protein KC19_10G013000 [Ceratodon purpureus]
MERSEPSLVPQWLKGASSGGVGGATHYSQASSNHQDESGVGTFTLRQRVQPHGVTSGSSHVDYDAPRFPPSSSSDRAYYSAVRRGPGGGSTGVSDRSIPEREVFSRGYNNFGRSTTYRSYDAGVDRSDRDTARERDWDWDRDRDRDGRDRSRVLGGFGGSEERERDRTEQSDNSSAFRRPGLGPVAGARYEPDIAAPLRRVHSMGSAARLENGEKKAADQGSLPTAPPTNSGSLTSSMQKAAFERNFPSLGAQERGAAISGMHSSLGNLVVSSPRPSWQGPSTHRMDGIRSAASSPGLPTGGNPGSGLPSATPGGVSGEGWSSALAEAPTTVNGTQVSPVASPGTVITPPTSSLANISLTGNSTNPPKMVEALAQHPPRVRTPPMYSAEKERLEERALMQSRQLIPMIPKTLGPVPRDKKVVRAVDVVAPPSTMKARQAIGSSQGLSSPYRPPASRPEALKLGQGTGKILSRKAPIKEVVPVLSPSPVTLKPDASPLVSTGVGPPGLGLGTTAVGVLNSAPRKQKQLLDRRALPIPPVLVPGDAAGIRPKDASLSGSDERRASVPTQTNRVDFFNALRRKAGLGGTPNIVDKLDVAPPKSNDIVNGDEVGNALAEERANHLLEDVGEEHPIVDSYPSENGDRHENDTTLDAEEPVSHVELFGNESKENGEMMEGTTYDQLFEDDITFMISLGWSKARVEETDALTQDEIDAFFQKRNELATNGAAQKRSSNHHHRGMNQLHVGSIGSETSGVTTSDSESEDDRK